nr:hypothetical protein [Pandoravirus aubagnensis]
MCVFLSPFFLLHTVFFFVRRGWWSFFSPFSLDRGLIAVVVVVVAAAPSSSSLFPEDLFVSACTIRAALFFCLLCSLLFATLPFPQKKKDNRLFLPARIVLPPPLKNQKKRNEKEPKRKGKVEDRRQAHTERETTSKRCRLLHPMRLQESRLRVLFVGFFCRLQMPFCFFLDRVLSFGAS